MKKTQFYVLITLALVPSYKVHAMLSPWSNATIVHRVHPLQRAEPEAVDHLVGLSNTPTLILWQTAFKAVDQGNLEGVKEHFGSWRYTVLPWDYYRQGIAQTLDHAAKKPAGKTGPIVQYLLSCAKKEYIEHPENLLKAGIENQHRSIIPYVEQNFGEHYTAFALDSAIKDANLTSIQTLLDAGVNPHAMLVTHDMSLSLHRALGSFSEKEDEITTQKRLTILAQLIDRLKPDQVPAAFQVNFCHGTKNSRSIPESLRLKVTSLLNAKHIPTRLCMEDARRVIKTTDTSIGIALTDADFPEEEITLKHAKASQPSPDKVKREKGKTTFPPSALHQAAKNGNYAEALAMITELARKMTQEESVPLKELSIINGIEEATAEERNAASLVMDAYRARVHAKMGIVHTVSRAAQLATDSDGRTAYDVARINNAPQNLIDLLDPQKPAFQSAIKEELEKSFMSNVEKKLESLKPECKPQVPSHPFPDKFKIGDTIMIDGVPYRVIEDYTNDKPMPGH